MSHRNDTTRTKPTQNAYLLQVLVFATFAVTAWTCPPEAAAQDVALTGRWRHQGGDAERAGRHQAIDRAIKDMNFFVRGQARKKLCEATAPSRELTIIKAGTRVSVNSGGRRLTLATDGSPTTVTGQGGSGKAFVRNTPGRMTVTVRTKGGTRKTVYRASKDGRRLTVDVTMTSEKLGGPVRYRMTYVRR